MFGFEKSYRDMIRDGNENICFLFLNSSFELIKSRMQLRKGHFMKTEMLKSQFETLEIPLTSEQDVIFIDISDTFEQVVERCIEALKPIL